MTESRQDGIHYSYPDKVYIIFSIIYILYNLTFQWIKIIISIGIYCFIMIVNVEEPIIVLDLFGIIYYNKSGPYQLCRIVIFFL